MSINVCVDQILFVSLLEPVIDNLFLSLCVYTGYFDYHFLDYTVELNHCFHIHYRNYIMLLWLN